MDLRGLNRIELNRGFGFVDCGIVLRSSLGWRMIERMHSLNCIDIVLELKKRRNEMDLILFVLRLGRMMVLRTQVIWICVEMKDCERNWSMGSVCRRDFVFEGELVVCEELARFLQITYY